MSTSRRSLGQLAEESTLAQRSGNETKEERAVPCLTIAWHPDLGRVGERVLLFDLVAGKEVGLSRLSPHFASSTEDPYPLGDRFLSRRPTLLQPGPDPGGLRILAVGPGLELDGESLDGLASRVGSVQIDADRLDRGATLLISGRVVLILHRVRELNPPSTPDFGLVGESCSMRRLRSQIQRVAVLDIPVLLRGETGTGKELVASAIHCHSRRRDGPHLAVNMAALPPTLAASELFGAARGAFTGADKARKGLFRRADGGTLFLDEIGETPEEVQALLLRALETHEIRPVGGDETQPVDVRLISATDADLETDIAAGRFRAPLLHRLSGFELRLPPLRDRRDDFGRLFLHFLRAELESQAEGARPEDGKIYSWLPAETVARLASLGWPGNVRQLRNVVRQLVVANRGEERARLPESVAPLFAQGREMPEVATSASDPEARRIKPADIDDDQLVELLRSHRFNLRAAAADIGISPTSLYGLIDKSPRLRKPAEIGRDEIVTALERVAGDVDAAALELQVSSLALKRRLRELDLP